jgi:hypothetical protein
VIDFLPLGFVPPNIYKSPTSNPFHFSHEDGYSMFRRNVGMDIRNHTAPKPIKTPALTLPLLYTLIPWNCYYELILK